MNLLDMRTVIISHTISSVISMVIMILLWMQNRKRFAGLGFWLANSIIQLVAIALFFLRGIIPDFLSIVAGNGLIVFGGFLLYIGLERFTGKQTNQLHNCLLLATFILIHSYYTFVQPSLLARNINISLALFLLSCQNAWLMLRRVAAEMRPITVGVGFIASAFSLIYIARIVLDSIIPIGDDFLRSNPYDTLIIMASQMLFIILAFGLTLMVNRRLISNLEQDINERKQTESALLEREKLYRQMFTDHTALMLLIDPDSGRIVEANPAAANFYGYPVEMLQNMKIDQINTSPPTKVAKDRQAAATGDQNYFVFSHRLASKEIRDVEVHSVPIQLGGSTLLYSIIHDITERKQAEDALLESEEKFYTAFHASPVVMAISTLEGGMFIDANTQFFKLTGYERKEVLGKMSTELGLWSDEARQSIIEELKEYGYAHRKEINLITKSGEPVPILWFGDVVHIDNKPCLISSGYDLREQRQAEQALRESEAFSQAVLKNSPIGISVRSRTGTLLSANDAWKRIWAIPESEVLGDREQERETLEFNARDDYLLQHQVEIRHVYEKGGYLHLPELKTTHPRPGGAEWVSQHFYAIKDEKGQVERVVILTEDISERKQTEKEIRESEDKFKGIFEQSPIAVLLYSTKGFLQDANHAAAETFGFHETKSLQNLKLFDNPNITSAIRSELESGKTVRFQSTIDFDNIRKLGFYEPTKSGLAFIDWVISPLSQSGYLVLIQDITERTQAEKELRRNAELNASLAALYPPLIDPDSTIENIAKIVLQQARGLTGSQHGYVSEIDRITGDSIGHTLTEMLVGQCQVQDEHQRIVFPRNDDGTYGGLWGHALNTRQAFFTNTPKEHHAVKGLPLGHIPLERFLSVPVLLGEELVGQIALSNPSSNYTDEDLNAIKRLAEFYALALQRKRAEKALEESEQKHRTMIANISDVVAIMDKNGILQYKSPNIEKHFGWLPEDLIGTIGWDTVHPDDLERIQKEFFALLERENATETVEYRYKHKDGEYSLIELTAVNLLHDTQINGVLMNYHDITDRKRMEDELKRQKSFFEQTFIQSATSTQILDQDGWCLRINPKLSELFGVKPEHIEGHVYNIFEDEEIKKNGIDTILKNVYEDQKVEKWEVHFDIGVAADSQNIEVKQKKKVWYANKAYPIIDSKGYITNVIVQHEDITERKLAEQAVQEALLDKEVLLRELYHRTKNNMQVISSMLNLEIGQTENEELEKTLRDMDNRIRSMALVHQKLYQSQNLSSLDLKDYIEDLASLMLESYQINPGRIDFSLQAESVPVLIDTAIPCGLIVNEILSNALKYAFPDKRKGNIQIRLERTKDATIVLKISDDGVGVPPDKDLRKGNTLGMQTIFGIAGHQLDAIVELETNHGVTWSIQFEDNLYTSRV